MSYKVTDAVYNDAVNIIKKNAVKKTADKIIMRLAGAVGEQQSAANILKIESKLPIPIVNYVIAKKSQEAARNAIVMFGDLLDERMGGKVRADLMPLYNEIMVTYLESPFKSHNKPISYNVKAKNLSKTSKKGKSKKKSIADHLEQKRQKSKINSQAGALIVFLEKTFNTTLEQPILMEDEDIQDVGKQIIDANLGIDSSLYMDIIKRLRDNAINILNCEAANANISQALEELRLCPINDPSSASTCFTNLINAWRANQNILKDNFASLQATNSLYQDNVNKLGLELRKAQQNVNDLESKLSNNGKEMSNISGQLTLINQNYDRLQNENRNLKQKIDENEAEFQQRQENLNKQILIEKQSYNELNIEKSQLVRENRELQDQLNEQKSEVNKYSNQLSIYDETNKQLAICNKVSADKIEDLKRQIELNKKNYEEIQQRFSVNEDQYKTMITDKENMITELQNEKSSWVAQKMRMDALAASNDSLENQVESYKNQVKELASDIAEKDKIMARLKAKGKDTDEQNNILLQERITTKAVIANLEKEIKTLTDHVEQNKAQVKSYESKYNLLENKQKTTEIELAAAKELIEKNKASYQEMERSNIESLNQINDLTRQINEATKERVNIATDCLTAKQNYLKYKAESLALKEETSKLNAKILKLENNIKQMKELSEQTFIAQGPRQNNEGDIEMADDAQVEVTTILVNQQVAPVIPAAQAARVLDYVISGNKKVSTAPVVKPPTLAEKKKSLNLSGGAYLVGGRPDPSFSRGKKFWKKAYNRGFKLF